jgi:hypothetical protein
MDLVHTYKTCYCPSQIIFDCRFKRLPQFDFSCLRSSLYSFGEDPTETPFPNNSNCYRGVFTSRKKSIFPLSAYLLPRNCLPTRCLAMDVCSDSTIPDFRRHIIVCFTEYLWQWNQRNSKGEQNCFESRNHISYQVSWWETESSAFIPPIMTIYWSLPKDLSPFNNYISSRTKRSKIHYEIFVT